MQKVSYEARGRFVVIKREKAPQLIRGVHVPESHASQIRYVVVSVGDEVKNLKAGDRVMILGKVGDEFFNIPDNPDYLGILEAMVPYKIITEEVPDPEEAT